MPSYDAAPKGAGKEGRWGSSATSWKEAWTRAACLPWSVAVAVAVALAAGAWGCPGAFSGTSEATDASALASFLIGGEVSGLVGEAVLADGNQSQLVVQGDGPFILPTRRPTGSTYDVGVVRAPPLQICDVVHGQGTVLAEDVTDVEVICRSAGSFPLWVSVAGLVGTSLLGVDDGAGQQSFGNGQSQVGALRPAGADFALTLSQPAGHVCSVEAGSALSGSMPVGPLTVEVNCVPQTYPVAFAVSGLLPGTQVQVASAGGQVVTLSPSAPQAAWPAPVPFGATFAASLAQVTSGIGCHFAGGQSTWQGVQGAQGVTVPISCTPTYKLTGTVAGAYADTPISLALGGTTFVVLAGQTTFSFADALSAQENWSLEVAPQPAGQRCSVQPVAGAQTAADVTVTVTCAPFLALSQGQAATQVMGQADFVSGSAGGGTTGWGENFTNPAVGTDGVVSVANSDGGRVLFFSSLPTMSGPTASFFIDGLSGFPHAMATDATTFALTRLNDNLINFYQPPPRAGGAAASFTLGGDTSCAVTGLQAPEDIHIYGNIMAVAANYQSRVLVWSSVPTTSGALPNVVLGAPDMVTCGGGTSAQLLSGATGVWFDDHVTAVVSPNNKRVLLYSHGMANLTTGQAADLVLGAPDFSTPGNGGPTLADFSPQRVASNGTQLFVTDQTNSRVLVWNSIPTTNYQPADLVLGQADGTSGSCNRGGSPAANTLCRPWGVTATRQALLVNDYANHRVLIYRTP